MIGSGGGWLIMCDTVEDDWYCVMQVIGKQRSVTKHKQVFRASGN
jgi:hypothetical protein